MSRLIIAFFLAGFMLSCGSEQRRESPVEPPVIQALESPADSASAEPYLFTDKNGLVYLSWITKEGQTGRLKYAVLRNGRWSDPSEIASGEDWFVNWADYPQVASDGSGNLIAHFLQKSERGTYTYDVRVVASTDNGKTWNQPFTLHDDGKKAEHGFVSIVPYGENFFISWLDGRNAPMESGDGHHGHQGAMTIRAAVIDKSGKKVSEWELDDRVCDCCQTGAAITANGPVVVYRDRSANEIRDISSVRFVNGQWTEPISVFTDNWRIEGCPVNGPRIDALENTVAVAWFTSPEDSGRVKVSFSRDGGGSYSAPIILNKARATGRVDIALLNETAALVSWMEGAEIKATRVYSDGRIDSAWVIASTSESRSSGFPQMTKAGDKIIFAWTDDKEKTIRLASMAIR